MRKLRSLEPSSFLKLLFAFFTLSFFVAAVAMPDRKDMFDGMWRIASQTVKVPTNCFDPAYGGYAGSFFNAGCVGLICTLLYCLPKAKASAPSVIGYLLTVGFAFWGVNVVNIWFGMLGVVIFCLLKKQPLGAQVNAMIFTTALCPLYSDLLYAYPHAEAMGFTWGGLALAAVVGIVVGILVPASLSYSPNLHKGFNLYSAAVPVGFLAFLLRGVLYQAMGAERGVSSVGPISSLSFADSCVCNIFCIVVFALCILGAIAMGCRGKDYVALLKDSGHGVDFSQKYGTAATLMNVGVFGLFIVLYYNVAAWIGGSETVFNAVTLGCILCMLATCCSGSHPRNVWPIMVSYIAMSFLCKWISVDLLGLEFKQAVDAQAILIGLCFANGLSPIAGRHGWWVGLIAGALHYGLVTSIPMLHGAYLLYNGGLTAAFVCVILVPVLEQFKKAKE